MKPNVVGLSAPPAPNVPLMIFHPRVRRWVSGIWSPSLGRDGDFGRLTDCTQTRCSYEHVDGVQFWMELPGHPALEFQQAHLIRCNGGIEVSSACRVLKHVGADATVLLVTDGKIETVKLWKDEHNHSQLRYTSPNTCNHCGADREADQPCPSCGK